MKTTKKIILSLILAVAALLPSFVGVASGTRVAVAQVGGAQPIEVQNEASSVDDFYLLSPTLVATNKTHTFVFDTETQKLKVIENGQIALTLFQQQPIRMVCCGEFLFVLSNSLVSVFQVTEDNAASGMALGRMANYKISQVPVRAASGGEVSDQDFDFQSVFTSALDFGVLQESENNYSVFVNAESQNNLDIHQISFTFNEEEVCFVAEYFDIVFNSNNASFGVVDEKLTQFAVSKQQDGYAFLCSNEQGLYLVSSKPALTCKELQNTTDPENPKEIVATSVSGFAGGFAYTTADGTYLCDTSGTTTQSSEVVPNALSSYHDSESDTTMVFGSITSSAQIVQIFPEEGVVYKNNFTAPQEDELQKFGDITYLRTKDSTLLKEYPYSVSGTTLPALTDLVVLKNEQDNFPNMAYVTCVVGGKNVRGFVSIQDCLVLTPSVVAGTARAIRPFALTSLPSSVQDENNVVLEQVAEDDLFELLSDVAQIKNTCSFLLIKTQSGKVGFAPRSAVASPLQTQKQKQNTNATIIRDSILYEDENGEVALLPLQKNTRVTLSSKLNPKSTYTYVSVELADGVHTGYVKTADIQSDGLTTLQIIGIILLVASIVILIFIVAFWTKNKKRQ